jgi:hypothetical protein
LLFVLIAVFHKNTPNTGCPVLGVHIRADKFSKLPKLEFFDTEGQKGRGWKAHRQVYE